MFKLPKTTLILGGMAILLAGGVTFQEMQRNATPPPIATTTKHFAFTPDTIQAIAIDHKGQILKLYRGSEAKPIWKMDQPTPVEVSEPAVSFLSNLLVDSQSDRDFTTDAKKLQEYGLVQPQGKLIIQLKNGKTHYLLLGNADFKGDSLYAIVDPPDPPTAQVKIRLVSRTFQDLIQRSPQDWRKVDSSQPSPAPQSSQSSQSPPTSQSSQSPSPPTSQSPQD
jgi:hemin uptake protein HemP